MMIETTGAWQALRLLITFDPYLWQIILLSLGVSSFSVLLSSLIGIPLGTWLAWYQGRSVNGVVYLLNTLVGTPPVLAGLLIYLLLSRSGPLGVLGWLYSPKAMVMAQVILAIPIIATLTRAAVAEKDKAFRELAQTLGATSMQAAWTVLREARLSIGVAIVTGFGRAISEVGAVMLVGGDIAHHTRVLTTAIVLETRLGNFDRAVALGLVLLLLSFLVNVILGRCTQGRLLR
jgi:tungstate transport system permease protein